MQIRLAISMLLPLVLAATASSADFSTTCKGEVTLEYEPPMMGMKQARTSQSGRWIGPCKDGMKPGDMILPDGRVMSLKKKNP